MKRLISFFSFAVVLGVNLILAQIVAIDNVEYIKTGKDIAECRVAKGISKSTSSLEILESVVINRASCKVTMIADKGFKGCKNIISIKIPPTIVRIGDCAFQDCSLLSSLTVPNSVEYIGEQVFWDCKSLQSITMPDNTTIKNTQHSFLGEIGIFSGCKKLKDIHGTTIEYPSYLMNALVNCNDVPFFKFMANIEFSDKRAVEFQPFSAFAKARIKAPIEQWQLKKEYETTAQWRERVTEKTREAKIQQLLDEARQEYIKLFAPKQLRAIIGTYDADYNIFPITADGMSTFYVRVPLEEAEAFKTGFNTVKLTPVYGIVDDKVGVLSCTFEAANSQRYFSAEAYDNDVTNDVALGLSPLEINVKDDVVAKAEPAAAPKVKIDNSIDLNIPTFASNNKRTFVFTIGNENYQDADAVPFAINDATVFSKYCNQTLGVPIKNLNRYKDVTYGKLLEVEARMREIARLYPAERDKITFIVYYAGHGFPEESTNNAYLLPVDGTPKRPEACYSLQRLYDCLGETGVGRAVVFLDACFTGSKRGSGMIAQARGTVIKPRECEPHGNTVVFAAASGMQTAHPYEEKGHGLFTYFLLRKLRDTKGEVSLGELSNYLSSEVNREATLTIKKAQNPEVVPSADFTGWENMKLK